MVWDLRIERQVNKIVTLYIKKYITYSVRNERDKIKSTASLSLFTNLPTAKGKNVHVGL